MVDPNSAIEAVGESAKAVNKLQEIIAKVYSPKWTRKQADAEAYADYKKIQLIRNNPDIDISFKDGFMNARQKTSAELLEMAQRRQIVEQIQQERNLESIIDIAGNALNNTEVEKNDSVDEYWLSTFIDIVKNISNEDLQLLWGKILAGEINNPGKFSLRTLDVLRKITQEEALLFEKVLPLVIVDEEVYFVPSYDSLMNQYDVYFYDIYQLAECGLITSSSAIIRELRNESDRPIGFHNENQLMVISEMKTTYPMSFNLYTLSCAGKELYRLLIHDSNDSFFSDFAKTIIEKNKNKGKMRISIFSVYKDNENNTVFDEENECFYNDEAIAIYETDDIGLEGNP